MKPIAEILTTAISEPCTKGSPACTKMPAPDSLARRLEFETFGDHGLESMVRGVGRFIAEIKSGVLCPWLVLLGTPGAGKSHLAWRVWRWWSLFGKYYTDGAGVALVHSGQFLLWADFIQECRSGDSSRVKDLVADDLVILDDIAAGADARGWMADKLYYIVEKRLDPTKRRATMITANLDLEQLGAAYDQRIASRLLRRGPDRVIVVDTMDYSLRPKP